MNILPISLAAVALALAGPTLLQTGGDKPQRPAAEPPKSATLEQLQGAWRLTRFESPTMREDKRQEVGYLLVSGSFLSFECHIGWYDSSGQSGGNTFFSGTHEFELRAGSVLVMTQLIGSTVNPNGSTPVFEPVGRRREYRVNFDGSRLVLTRDRDGQSFTFERVAGSGGGLDFYGRRKQPPKPETPAPTGGEKGKDGEKQGL